MSRGDNAVGGMVIIVLGLVVFGFVWGVQQIVGLFDDEAVEVAQLKLDAGLDEARPLGLDGSGENAKAEGEHARVEFPKPAKALDAAARAKRLAAILAKLGQANLEHADTLPAVKKPKSPDSHVKKARHAVKGSLSKEFIMDAVGEIKPLLKECYELAMVEKSSLEGKLKVRFEIVGDEEYGSLVTMSEIVVGENEVVPSALLAECVKETMFALDLPAPPNGGKIIVTYPFVFKSSSAEDQ